MTANTIPDKGGLKWQTTILTIYRKTRQKK